MMNSRIRALSACVVFAALPVLAADGWVTLAGEWRFALDPVDQGIQQRWFQKTLEDTIPLPGTTDEARKGTLNSARETEHLTRLYPYLGAAWYQRDIDVPADWTGKRIVLVLERTKTEPPLGGRPRPRPQDSLVAPHDYRTRLARGRQAPAHSPHRQSRNTRPLAIPHQISDHTQTNWNGVIGKIGLRVTDPVWLDDVQIYPDRAARKLQGPHRDSAIAPGMRSAAR